jgi:ribosome-associated heat shock protein Hsp15
MANTTIINKVRIDKWLWSVRIFKSRTQATDACTGSKISISGNNVKASHNVQRGDLIQVKKGGFTFTYKVIELIDKRVGAELAAPCYENQTPDSELNKFKDWYLLNSVGEQRDRGVGRPTKRDRRDIDSFKESDFEDMD